MAGLRFLMRPRLRRRKGAIRLQASGRCRIDTEGSRYIGLRFASREPRERFVPLMAVQLERTAKSHAAGLSALPAFTGAGAN